MEPTVGSGPGYVPRSWVCAARGPVMDLPSFASCSVRHGGGHCPTGMVMARFPLAVRSHGTTADANVGAGSLRAQDWSRVQADPHGSTANRLIARRRTLTRPGTTPGIAASRVSVSGPSRRARSGRFGRRVDRLAPYINSAPRRTRGRVLPLCAPASCVVERG